MNTAEKPKKARKQTLSDLTVITEAESIFCHLMIAGKVSPAECARTAGFKKPGASTALLRKPRVIRYMEAYVQQFASMMAQRELDSIVRYDIDRGTLIQKLWNLASLPPERTRGTIQGQVEAIDKISGMLGLKLQDRNMDEFFKGKTDEQVRNYLDYGTFDAPVTN